MNRKLTLDISIVLSCITGMFLSYAYLGYPAKRLASFALLGVTAFLFFLLALADREGMGRTKSVGESRSGISEILLLSEEGGVTDTWDSG